MDVGSGAMRTPDSRVHVMPSDEMALDRPPVEPPCPTLALLRKRRKRPSGSGSTPARVSGGWPHSSPVVLQKLFVSRVHVFRSVENARPWNSPGGPSCLVK